MRLYSQRLGLAEKLVSEARPSVTLRSGVARDLGPIRYWRELLKLKARALVHRGATRRWLHLLNSHPAFSEYVKSSPRLLYKIYRPYLTSTLSMDARLDALASHYQFIFQRGLGPTVALASHSGVTLALCEGKSGIAYQLKLRAVGTLEREGELALQLCQHETVLCTIGFSFAWRFEAMAVSVGCIQGGKAETTREAIRCATRELHGARPKQLLVTLVRYLGHAFGCRELYLVSNANRVVHGAMRQGRVRADYDQLWQEMGGARLPDGDWMLPCTPLPALDLDSVVSKKRSEARRRHDLMTALAAQLKVRLLDEPFL
jgi:uncharacterized protein VirK/YbjX